MKMPPEKHHIIKKLLRQSLDFSYHIHGQYLEWLQLIYKNYYLWLSAKYQQFNNFMNNNDAY